jgi:mono/diheme cytochrome c family protein
MAGAMMLDVRTYEDVEADRNATGHALVVILLASVAAGIGASGWSTDAHRVAALSSFAGLVALLAWASWALLTYEIGARVLPEPQTRADVGELLRTLGFSAAPGVFLVFGILPGLTAPVFAFTAVWMLAAMVVALRQALDYESTVRAVVVCGLGWLLALVMVVILGLAFGTAVAHSGPGPQASPAEPAQDGAQLFKTYCASCHGPSGLGNGPMAELMRRQPSDLTRYAARNSNVFPQERLRRIIDGRDVPSHGERNMPIWGDAFRFIPDERGGYPVQARIDALVKYLEAIQIRSAH